LNLKDHIIWSAWKEAVGSHIATQTRVDRFYRKTLFIKVSNSVWMHQLQFMKDEIMGRVNGIAGKSVVQNIFFSIGSISSAHSLPKNGIEISSDNTALNDREKKRIEKSLSPLKDNELIEILRRTMTKNLIRRKMSDRRKEP
jgi:hypothetical protein